MSGSNGQLVKRFNALIDLRAAALRALRAALEAEQFTEVSTATLVNVAGSCEDPTLSFRLKYFQKEAFLSQSAQLQLEPLVIRLSRKVYSVSSSFRAEDFQDPVKKERILSEFTLVEPEAPYFGSASDCLDELQRLMESVVRNAATKTVEGEGKSIEVLGGDPAAIVELVGKPFQRITYDDAVTILTGNGHRLDKDSDLGISEERMILKEFGNVPVLVSGHPAKAKFFNIKTLDDGKRALSCDLLLSPMGEVVGGGVREENVEVLKRQLADSKVGAFIRSKGADPLVAFGHYLSTFDSNVVPLRFGFGVGFERFVATLIGATDILETVFHRSLRP